VGKGMATWYKNTGPWWDHTNLRPGDGISLEEERSDPNSLFNFYKKIIRLRQSHGELINGKYHTLANNNEKVFSFSRMGKTAICIAINLSDKEQQAAIDVPRLSKKIDQIWGKGNGKISGKNLMVSLPAYGIAIWEIP
jgi:glycosidase